MTDNRTTEQTVHVRESDGVTYRETHMEIVSECGKYKQSLKLDTYVTYSELRELIAMVMGVEQ